MSEVQRSRLFNRARTAAWSPTPPRLNRWLTQPAEERPGTGTSQTRSNTPGRVFEVWTPTGAGGESLERGVQVRRPPGGHKPGRCGRSAILSGRAPALDPRAARSGAARRGPPARGGGGRTARAPAPPPRAGGGAVAAPPRAPPGETRARQVPDKRMRPARGPLPPLGRARAPKTGWAAPLDGPEPPLGAPALHTQPNGFRDACPGARRDRDASVSPAFPEGSARALTSESRRSEAEEGGYPGASSSGSWSSSLHLSGRASSRGRRSRWRTDCWGGFPAVTAPPQPRSSLPLRVAPAFCFTRGTANAAAAMLTTEPGGGARTRLAECGCASPADGAPGRPGPRVPAPRPRRPPGGSFLGAPGGRVAPPRRNPGRPPPSRAPGSLPRPDCARVVVAAAAARLLATLGKWVNNGRSWDHSHNFSVQTLKDSLWGAPGLPLSESTKLDAGRCF